MFEDKSEYKELWNEVNKVPDGYTFKYITFIGEEMHIVYFLEEINSYLSARSRNGLDIQARVMSFAEYFAERKALMGSGLELLDSKELEELANDKEE